MTLAWTSIISFVVTGYIASLPIARWAMLESYPTKFALSVTALAGVLAYFGHALPPVMLFLVALALLAYVVEIRGPAPVRVSMVGKTVLVTGANSGIGLETARQLALLGAEVIMGCRTPAKAEEARASIEQSLALATLAYDSAVAANAAAAKQAKASGKDAPAVAVEAARPGTVRVLPTPLDLSSLSSVRNYVQAYKAAGLALDVLVLNAGVIPARFELTKDGVESAFAANHLGHFLLTRLMLPLLADAGATQLTMRAAVAKKAAAAGGDDASAAATQAVLDCLGPARVVVLSSSLHWSAKAAQAAEPCASASAFSSFPVYARCKLANLLFAKRLVQFVASTPALAGKVTVNSLHPGNPITGVTGTLNGFLRYAEAACLPLMYLYRETPHAGAFCSVFAATSPELRTANGLYLIDSDPAPRSAEADDQRAADALWTLSEKLCGL